MQDNDPEALNEYIVGGKAYSEKECESIYAFWKARLNNEDIRDSINTVLESADSKDRGFTQWVKSHINNCIDAVAKDRQQEEFFQSILQDGGDTVLSLSSVEVCLRGLFARSVGCIS